MGKIFLKPLWVVTFALLFLAACTSSAPHGDYTAELAVSLSTSRPPVAWQLPVSSESAHIVSELTLSSWDRLNVSIDDKRGNALAVVRFSDADCDFGHEAYISHPGESLSVQHRVFFDEQFPLDQPIALELSWGGEGRLLVALNGHIHSVRLMGSPRSVQVQTMLGQPEISEFRYQAFNTQSAKEQ